MTNMLMLEHPSQSVCLCLSPWLLPALLPVQPLVLQDGKPLISSHSGKPRLFKLQLLPLSLPLCLIFLLFPICSTHYVIKAINMFMEQLFHVAIKTHWSNSQGLMRRWNMNAEGPKDKEKLCLFVCVIFFYVWKGLKFQPDETLSWKKGMRRTGGAFSARSHMYTQTHTYGNTYREAVTVK